MHGARNHLGEANATDLFFYGACCNNAGYCGYTKGARGHLRNPYRPEEKSSDQGPC